MSEQTERVLENYEVSVDELQAHLQPLLDGDIDEILESLEPIQRSELLLALAYSSVSLKFNHLTILNMHPFWMGSRQTNQAIVIGRLFQKTGDLTVFLSFFEHIDFFASKSIY